MESDITDDTEPKFMSIILTNLQINFDGWKAELPKEEKETPNEEMVDEFEDEDEEKPDEDEENPVTGVEPQEGSTDVSVLVL